MDSACGFSLLDPPMKPKSPTAGLDLYGKRRKMVKVQALEREIDSLQEELKAIEDLQPASRCCKELDDFLGGKLDPFIAIKQENCKFHSIWKRPWGGFCANLLWVCRSWHCLRHLRMRNCCTRNVSFGSRCPSCICSGNITCQDFGKCAGLSCPRNSCCCFMSVVHNCKEANLCSEFPENCASTCL